MLISNCLSELEAADFADMVSYIWKVLRVETQRSFLISFITSLSIVSLDFLLICSPKIIMNLEDPTAY